MYGRLWNLTNKTKIIFQANLIIFGILAVVAIILLDTSAFIFLLASGILLILLDRLHKNISNKASLIEKQRLEWLLSRLETIDSSIISNPDNFWNYLKSNKSKFSYNLFNRELGMPQPQIQRRHVAPDLEHAENELAKSEERASILLGVLVFLPVLFGIMHLFRNVTLITYLIELHVFFLLGQLVILSQTQAYQIEGWNDSYQDAEKLLNEIEKLGRRSLLSSNNLVNDARMQELGIEITNKNESPAIMAVGSLLNQAVRLPQNQRQGFLLNTLEKLDDLPKQESLISQRWNAYQNRLYLIGCASVAISAQIAGLSNFTIPKVNTGLELLQTTKYLPWGLFILSIGLNTAVLSYWVSWKKQVLSAVVFGMIYLAIFYLNKLLLM